MAMETGKMLVVRNLVGPLKSKMLVVRKEKKKETPDVKKSFEICSVR